MKFKSGLITQGSGSIGGTVVSHNRGGMYTRARTIPTNPNTERQQWARSAFGGRIQGWNALTDPQRTAWKLYADNTPVLNTLGDSIKLSGQNMYVRTNSARANARAVVGSFGGTITLPDINDAPVIYNTGEPVYMVGSAVDDSGDFTLAAVLSAPASAGGTGLLYVGRPQNYGRSFYKGPYQLADFAAVTPASTALSFNAPDTSDPTGWFSSVIPVGGMWLPVRISISYLDGRLSQDFRTIVMVEAA